MTNIKTLLNEIKRDVIEYNLEYLEYESNINGWERIFIKEGDKIIYHYKNEKGYFMGSIDVNRFIILSNKAIISIIASDYYYNYIEEA